MTSSYNNNDFPIQELIYHDENYIMVMSSGLDAYKKSHGDRIPWVRRNGKGL